MITVNLNRTEFEYDIHSLLKAFFPKEDVEIYYTAEAHADEKNVACTNHFAENANEEQLMDDALEAGADDIITEEDGFEVVTTPEDFNAVKDALLEKGYEFVSADVKLVPQTTTVLSDEAQVKAMEKLIDLLEDDDDVQNVFHNWEQE